MSSTTRPLIDETVAGSVLAASLKQTLEIAKQKVLAPEYTLRRDSIFETLLAGKTPDLAEPWSPFGTKYLDSLRDLALAAMNEATNRAAMMRSSALSRLAVEAALLLGALVFSIGGILLVNRCVVWPLLAMTNAMSRLAGRDMAIKNPVMGRTDEIGPMANAAELFKQSIIDAARLTAEQDSGRLVKERRSEALDNLPHVVRRCSRRRRCPDHFGRHGYASSEDC